MDKKLTAAMLSALCVLSLFLGGEVRADEKRSERVDAVLETTDGWSGYHFREIGGETIAARNAGYVFEPASSIKVLYHLHALLEVQAGRADLAETVHTSTVYTGSCPVASPLPSDLGETSGWVKPESFERALELMMRASDNARTQTIRRRFGRTAVNATAAALGLENTEIRHEIGCLFVSLRDDVPYVEPVSDLPGTLGPHYANRFTLEDASRLYESALGRHTSILSSALQEDMRRLMNGLDGDIVAVVEEESEETFGMPVPTAFWENLAGAYKTGSYAQIEPRAEVGSPENPTEHIPHAWWYTNTRPVMGWLRLPFQDGHGDIITRDYTYGVFIDRATDRPRIDAKRDLALRELVRVEIRRALGTFAR